eukprot:GHVT01045923.1.p1 GENE.GHVT01045923.1~~GHVT01045923.1.p1  ORF type:complete len:272 (+),score=43.86 GHVT01045923.1:23-838(+)
MFRLHFLVVKSVTAVCCLYPLPSHCGSPPVHISMAAPFLRLRAGRLQLLGEWGGRWRSLASHSSAPGRCLPPVHVGCPGAERAQRTLSSGLPSTRFLCHLPGSNSVPSDQFACQRFVARRHSHPPTAKLARPTRLPALNLSEQTMATAVDQTSRTDHQRKPPHSQQPDRKQQQQLKEEAALRQVQQRAAGTDGARVCIAPKAAVHVRRHQEAFAARQAPSSSGCVRGRSEATEAAVGGLPLLRVSVESGGCSGFSYRFEYVDRDQVGPSDT